MIYIYTLLYTGIYILKMVTGLWNCIEIDEQLVVLSCRAMLFCSLTNQLIKKRHSAVQEHLKGKKFMRAKGKKPSSTVCAIPFRERLDDATQVNHLSDLILLCNP